MLKRTANFRVRTAREVTDDVADQAVERNLRLIEAGVQADPNLDRFREIVAGIKKVAPRSDDFIYFVCRAIHSMEAANIDPVTGKVTGDGFVNEAGVWESPTGRTPFPYVNQNGDAFPEKELLKVAELGENGQPDKLSYHTFIGRGLFVNHASDDAEKIRGIILDATWDEKTKGVDLLVACDKIAYPELARQIQAGYSNDVSMGTQVSHSVCSECGNVAKTEDDYCDHIRTAKGSFFNGRPVYEANFGLNFIEISVVATGADPKAKIRQVLAHLNKAVQARRASLEKVDEKMSDSAKLSEAQRAVDTIRQALKTIASTENVEEIDLTTLGIDQFGNTQMADTNSDETDIKSELENLRTQLSELQQQIKNSKGAEMATDKKAYFNNEGEPDSGLNTTEQNNAEFKQNYQNVRDNQDKQMVGKGMESGDTGMHPGYGESDEALKKRLLRANKLRARLRKADSKSNYRWIVLAGEEPILEASAGDLYGDDLDKPNAENAEVTNFEWVASAEYGKNLITAIRQLGLEEVQKQIQAASSCSMSKKNMNKDEMEDQTKDKKEDKKEDKKVKAQLEEPPVEPIEAATGEEPPVEPEPGLDEEAAAAEEEDLLAEEGLEEEAAAGELAPETATALQEVADMIADAGEQLAALIGAEGALDEEAMAEGEELGEEVVEAGEELAGLDEAMGQAEAAAPAEGEELPPDLATAKAEMKKLVEAASKDAKVVAAKAQKFIKAHKKADTLAERRAARRAIAQKLYDLTNEDMTAEAHPKGNTTAVPGYEVKTGHGIHDASEDVATKNPTGNLTASQKARRVKVAKFIKAMDDNTPDFIKEKKEEAEEKKNEEAEGEKKEEAEGDKKEAVTKGKKTEAAADSEASKYYKELYNSDPEAKAFANDLTKDFNSKQATADVDNTKGKMHRAYKVALRQAQLGQINNTAEAVENQVETLMSMDDQGFDAFSHAVENTAKATPQTTASSGSVLKTASANVPTQGESVADPRTQAIDSRSAQIKDLTDRLGSLGWSVSGRR